MKASLFLVAGILMFFTSGATAQTNQQSVPAAETITATDLSRFIYSYGAVLKVNSEQIVLQEYDYDSDVEKEVVYQLDSAVRLEGIKAVTELGANDVVEVYYLEQDGKKTAKIIRREIIEDENTPSDN